jgi:hypothetical protein
MHVDGVDNKVADCLSRYYENGTGNESHPEHIYVNADARLDPDGELLPTDRYMELKTATTRRSDRLTEKKGARTVESEAMNEAVRRSRITHRSSKRRCGCRTGRRTAQHASNVVNQATLRLTARNSSIA